MPYKFRTEKIKLGEKYDRRVKLTENIKNKIRKEYSLGNTSYSMLAKKYKVSKRLIGLIVNKHNMENMKKYIKAHWKEHQQKGEEWNKVMREHCHYKQTLYLEGKIKCGMSEEQIELLERIKSKLREELNNLDLPYDIIIESNYDKAREIKVKFSLENYRLSNKMKEAKEIIKKILSRPDGEISYETRAKVEAFIKEHKEQKREMCV